MVTKNTDFWLNEADLKTPIHDEMVLWTFNNAETIIKQLALIKYITYFNHPKLDNCLTALLPEDVRWRELIGSGWDWDKQKIIIGKLRYEKDKELIFPIQKILAIDEDIKVDIKANHSEALPLSYEKIIEYPLKGYNGFNLGYIDLRVYVTAKEVTSPWFTRKIADVNEYDRDKLSFCFEIKPEVKSIGEVLRQFQYYKSNLGNHAKLVLVTKTTGLKEIFESQGFYVVEYKKEEKANE